ncbi:hypothetical protein ACT8ZV_07070 [Nocardioides sp. MAHUQ-72]|uniref:hypothetical protein n=1 Tax=unclassified Nocardioides TaxID=2615069 RepID=UPI003619F20A
MSTSTRITATGIGALVLGTGIGLTAFAGGSTTAAPAGRTNDPPARTETMVLAFPWVGGHMRYIDNGKAGEGPGDLFLGTDGPILDNATGQRVGVGDFVELIVSGRHDGTVTGQTTLRLAGGHVDLDGIVRHTDDPFRTPVVGGTGRYVGVTGQLTLLRSDSHRKVEVMRLESPTERRTGRPAQSPADAVWQTASTLLPSGSRTNAP